MRRAELVYLVALVGLTIAHGIMSIPFIVDTADIMLSSYSWIMYVFIAVPFLMYFVKTMGYIQRMYAGFHSLSVLAMIVSVMPIFSFIFHLVSAVAGSRSIIKQYGRVKDLYSIKDLRSVRESERLKYGTEDFSDLKEEINPLQEFLKRDVNEHKEEYDGFTERDIDASDYIETEVIVEDSTYSTDDVVRSDMEYLLTIRGEDAVLTDKLSIEDLADLSTILQRTDDSEYDDWDDGTINIIESDVDEGIEDSTDDDDYLDESVVYNESDYEPLQVDDDLVYFDDTTVYDTFNEDDDVEEEITLEDLLNN